MSSQDPRQVDFYFDYISHNAYLAWHLLPDMAKTHGYSVRPVPVLFAGFLKTYGQLGPAEIEPKLAWMNRNNLRKARTLGIPLDAPKTHPFNPLLLLRMTAQKMPDATRHRIIGKLLRGVWVDRLDPNDTNAISAYLSDEDVDVASLIAGASSDQAKAQLKSNCDEAIARGSFGVPTMIAGDEVFWGFDDLPYLEAKLSGHDPLESFDTSDYDNAWAGARAAGAHRQR